ncbi:hypothetical protein CUZ87_1278 [Enterococcus xinjiangensis]|nr:hypothetical protein [Enterococcus lactis]MBL5010003.1 hypothetical protein [Enterococcus lactis]
MTGKKERTVKRKIIKTSQGLSRLFSANSLRLIFVLLFPD